jgi:replicative DNA helicase
MDQPPAEYYDNQPPEKKPEQQATPSEIKRPRRQKAPPKAPVDRLPPHALDMEQGVLGCAMISPNDVLTRIVPIIENLGPTVFYDLRHQEIYKWLAVMFKAREPIDMITLQQKMKDNSVLDLVGGLPYLSTIPDIVPSAANLQYYFDSVLEKYQLRKLITTCTETVSRVYDYEGDVPRLMDEFEVDALRVRVQLKDGTLPTMKTNVQKAVTTIEDYHEKRGQLLGISTGFPDLDKMTSGLIPGEVFVIAARPSMGKTSLAMNMAEHVAIHQRLPVGVFSLEMTRESLVLRMLASRSRVNLRNVQKGYMKETDFPKITGSAGKLAGCDMWIDDTSGLSITTLQMKARRMVQEYGIKLFVIDYLGLLHSVIGGRRRENKAQEVADCSAGVKQIAKELHVPVILLCQLNRDLEKDKGARKPSMADLRDSGSIEQDADTIGFLYKVTPTAKEEATYVEGEEVPVNLLIAKQRNGPTGEVELTFLKQFTRYENRGKIVDDVDQQGSFNV